MIVKSQFDKSQGADAIGSVRDIALMKEAHGYDARAHSAGRAGRGCASKTEEQQAMALPTQEEQPPALSPWETKTRWPETGVRKQFEKLRPVCTANDCFHLVTMARAASYIAIASASDSSVCSGAMTPSGASNRPGKPKELLNPPIPTSSQPQFSCRRTFHRW